MNIKKILRQSVIAWASAMNTIELYVDATAIDHPATQIVVTGDPTSTHKTTDAQRYLVQRLAMQQVLHAAEGVFLVHHHTQRINKTLRIHAIDDSPQGRPRYDVVYTTRAFNKKELDFSDCSIFHFQLCDKRISEVRMVTYRRLSMGASSHRIVDYKVALQRASVGLIEEIESRLVPQQRSIARPKSLSSLLYGGL